MAVAALATPRKASLHQPYAGTWSRGIARLIHELRCLLFRSHFRDEITDVDTVPVVKGPDTRDHWKAVLLGQPRWLLSKAWQPGRESLRFGGVR